MLELKNIRKLYTTNLVLEIPALKLENDIYWIKGENGSGKTTLLKMMAGLLPFEGDILFKNISLKNKPLAYRKQISWAEAEPLYPSFLTGNNLISLYKDIRGAAQKEIDVLVDALNMTESIHEPTGTYSAGMNKKLSLILAFTGNPELIILDEPLITLDPFAFSQVCSIILEKRKNDGTFFLMSSHQNPGPQLSASVKQLTVINKSIIAE
jgi:ABC-2 type transport system ATP-binding protein